MSEPKERRHAFRSFKERIDAMKIEPNKRLNTRAHDYVESSHFLATLEHWKEVNISGDFTAFLRQVEPLCQTLPQILHHQKTIFGALESHIQNNDVNSIQPLLELLSQFIHDLGPDFMPFYTAFLHLVVALAQKTNPNDAQNMRNSSNVLEWCFNTLAFSFKYLSRVLTQDLTPTFAELLPVLEMTKKTYVSRFCAEALSFLVKKSKPETLKQIVHFSFNEHQNLLETSNFYRESLIVLYSEAMKNTQDTFHSKSGGVFSVLLENALAEHSSTDVCVATLCDILLVVSQHGSAQACERFYAGCTAYLVEVVQTTEQPQTLGHVTQVLLSMVFPESGKKIHDWKTVFAVVDAVVHKASKLAGSSAQISPQLMALLAHLFSVIVRNCPTAVLSKHFEYMAGFLAASDNNKYFLSFYELCYVNAPEKMATFGGVRTLQTVVNKTTSEEQLVYLAQKLSKMESSIPEAVSPIVILSFLAQQLLEMMESDLQKPYSEAVLRSLFWKLKLLQFSPENESTTPLRVLQKLSDESLPQTPFLHDVLGTTVSITVKLSKATSDTDSAEASQIYKLIRGCLGTCRDSLDFLDGATKFVQKHAKKVSLLASDKDEICEVLAANFSLPDRGVRVKTADFLAKLHESVGLPLPFVISQIRINDQVPLTIPNANDVKMRLRHFMGEFSNKKRSSIEKRQMSQYVVGLLSNSFQPCWLAVYESIAQVAQAGCAEDLWHVLMHFVKLDYQHQHEQYAAEEFEPDMEVVPTFDVLDERLRASVDAAAATVFSSESAALTSLLKDAHKHSIARSYNPQIRTRIITALQAVPYIVEQHGPEFIDYVVQLQISDDDAEYSSWTNKDKLAMVAVAAKFKKMRRIDGNEKLFALVLENLSSKHANIQSESLEILFAWNKPQINKYRDNLKNLLEDKLFRDELQSLVNKNADSKIEDQDAPEVIPIVLRILYGRAKGASNNKSKNGRKFAIATVLPNLPEAYIAQFLAILAQQIQYEPFFETGELPEISRKYLSSMVGYLNMLLEVYNGLGYKFAHVLPGTIRPLTYTLLCSQKVLDAEGDDELTGKIARTVRSLGFRCLDHLFKITGASHDWTDDAGLVFSSIVKPRLALFAQENAQQPSALMGTILGWINSPRLVPFLYMDDFSAVAATMDLLANAHAKDPVKAAILDFCIAAFTRKDIEDDKYYTLLALVVDGLLAVLPRILEDTEDKDINARAATLLLLIIEGGYVREHATRKALLESCASAIRKPPAQIGANDRVSLLLSLVSILDGFECAFADISTLYDVCSSAFRSYKDRNVREALVQIFGVLGAQFPEVSVVSGLLADLNAYSPSRRSEPDFERRLGAFKTINEQLYTQLSPVQWLPIVQACLFFINDPDEMALRTNASYTLTQFIAGLAGRPDADGHKKLFYDVVVSNVRAGLKKDSDDIKDGYIHVLAAAVKHHRLFPESPEFASMSVLLSDDPDTDYFQQFTHIQIKCRQQAIRSLAGHKDQLSAECLYHYLLPMTESYTACDSEKMRPVLDDTHITWAQLVPRLRWDHFRTLFRKHIRAAGAADATRDQYRLVVHLSSGMAAAFAGPAGLACMPESTEGAIMRDFFEPIMKVVRVGSDDTVEARTLLVEAAVNCLLCVPDAVAESAISGTLTSTCQVLRSRYQPTRDAVRRTLCKVAKLVGAKYLKFLVQELKTALSRGAQIHVLSYTLHAVLAAVREDLEPGDLDDSAPLIVDIVMEDIFGAAGQDKDAEGYVSSWREVKSKKSFDTGEVLCTNISLPAFKYLVEPVKMLLKVNIPLKTRRKLDDLLVKYSHGIMHNAGARTRDVLVLCYELHQQSTAVEFAARKAPATKEDHFLVAVSRPVTMTVDRSQVVFALQKWSYELMRSALGKHPHLMTVANLDGFLPLIESSLDCEDEGLLVSLFRVLDVVVRLDFGDARVGFFTLTATRAYTVIQNLASTANELSQTCLRYLATIVRYRPEVKLSDSAMTYVLVRILPDLEEPEKQGLAFNFLRAVLHRHVMLPEVYEVMDKVASILVVNHNKEIRDMARILYLQFLMEYEQGPAKLEKAFRFLVNNLAYPTQAGRESVMEVMHSIVSKSSEALLAQLATSFFVGLANVAVGDDASKCREMAAALLLRLFQKAGKTRVAEMENFTLSWMAQKNNRLLRRCGLSVYKIYLSAFGYGACEKLDSTAFSLVDSVIASSRNGDANKDQTDKETERSYEDDETDTAWEDVYTAMSVFSGMCQSMGDAILQPPFEPIWRHVLDSILYPHTWVRLLCSRLVGVLLSNLDKVAFSLSGEQLQTISYRLLRQLGAPVVAPDLGTQVVKNMIQLVTKWNSENAPYYAFDEGAKQQDKEETGENVENRKDSSDPPRYASAVDFVLARVCALMRHDTRTDPSLTARKAAIQLGAVIAHIVPAEKLPSVARQLLLGLYYILEQDAYTDAENEVLEMAKECNKALEDKLGVTAYSEIWTSVRKQVDQKRSARRAKEAHLAVHAPDVAARRKLKKHENFRAKRKNRKDENGYYRAKRTKRNEA